MGCGSSAAKPLVQVAQPHLSDDILDRCCARCEAAACAQPLALLKCTISLAQSRICHAFLSSATSKSDSKATKDISQQPARVRVRRGSRSRSPSAEEAEKGREMLESLEIKRERIEELKKINEHLDLQRNELLKQMKQAVDAPGGKDHPKNKPTISRLFKEAKAKQGVIDSNLKTMELLTDQCSVIEAVIYRQGDAPALSSDSVPDMKSTIASLTAAIDATNDKFQEVKDVMDEFQGVLGGAVSHDVDDDELFAALGELDLDAGQREPAAGSAAALPALAYLPPAGSKALPAHGAAAVGEVEDAELERIKCSM